MEPLPTTTRFFALLETAISQLHEEFHVPCEELVRLKEMVEGDAEQASFRHIQDGLKVHKAPVG
jgi:hypothetical protein